MPIVNEADQFILDMHDDQDDSVYEQGEIDEYKNYLKSLKDRQKELDENQYMPKTPAETKQRQLEVVEAQAAKKKKELTRKDAHVKVNKGAMSETEIDKVQQNELLKRLKGRSAAEEEFFDIALSGTCATLVIQLPKLLIIAWVGDSLCAM